MIGSTVLTSLSLLVAFKDKTSVDGDLIHDLGDSYGMSGAIFGAIMFFLFVAITMLSVQKSVGRIW